MSGPRLRRQAPLSAPVPKDASAGHTPQQLNSWPSPLPLDQYSPPPSLGPALTLCPTRSLPVPRRQIMYYYYFRRVLGWPVSDIPHPRPLHFSRARAYASPPLPSSPSPPPHGVAHHTALAHIHTGAAHFICRLARRSDDRHTLLTLNLIMTLTLALTLILTLTLTLART